MVIREKGPKFSTLFLFATSSAPANDAFLNNNLGSFSMPPPNKNASLTVTFLIFGSIDLVAANLDASSVTNMSLLYLTFFNIFFFNYEQ
jgi:hypothetical protein